VERRGVERRGVERQGTHMSHAQRTHAQSQHVSLSNPPSQQLVQNVRAYVSMSAASAMHVEQRMLHAAMNAAEHAVQRV